MAISIVRETVQRYCDNTFRVEITISHSWSEDVRIRFGILSQSDNVVNAQVDDGGFNLGVDDERDVVITGILNGPCAEGEIVYEFARRIDGNDFPGSYDSILIALGIPKFKAEDAPDPVQAEPNGTFVYDTFVECCPGAPAAQSIPFETQAGEGVAAIGSTDTSPLTLNCPGGVESIAVSGILSDPNEAGIGWVVFRSDAGYKCFVLTTIEPPERVDEKGYQQARREYGLD